MTSKKQISTFQKSLDTDPEMRADYIYSDGSDSSDSEADSEICKIIVPSHKKKIHSDTTSQELLFQYLRQNQALASTQKKLYKIQSELDKEEITSRYIKLDLNNAQVMLDETKELLKQSKSRLFKTDTENMVLRGVIFLYIIFRIYSMF